MRKQRFLAPFPFRENKTVIGLLIMAAAFGKEQPPRRPSENFSFCQYLRLQVAMKPLFGHQERKAPWKLTVAWMDGSFKVAVRLGMERSTLLMNSYIHPETITNSFQVVLQSCGTGRAAAHTITTNVGNRILPGNFPCENRTTVIFMSIHGCVANISDIHGTGAESGWPGKGIRSFFYLSGGSLSKPSFLHRHDDARLNLD